MVTHYPLLAGLGVAPLSREQLASHIVAYQRGKPRSAQQYLADCQALAKALERSGARYVLNVCGDRYVIAVSLGACMQAGVVNLMPPNTAPETLRSLTAGYSPCVALTDSGLFSALPCAAIDVIALLKQSTVTAQAMFDVPQFAAETVVAQLFTSGSTGEPTPITRTWGALSQSVRAEAVALRLHIGPSMPILATVPAQHSYGLESSLALPMLTGHAIAADQSFYPADIVEALQRLPSPRILVTTPFHLRTLLEAVDEMPGVALSNALQCDLVVSATAPLSPQLAQHAERRLDCAVREIFGCTESGQIAARRTTAGDAWQLFPGLTLTQADQDGVTVTSVVGGHTGEAPTPLGDAVELLPDQSFKLFGRIGDMINMAGKRSSLAYLNFHLNSIEGVEDGVFFSPDALRSETTEPDSSRQRLGAIVVAPSLTERALLAALRERIDPLFLPRPVCFVKHIPRNATGKVTQAVLHTLLCESAKP